MKIAKLPNGFVLDLDSVHYIGSEHMLKHPFTGEPTDERRLIIYCEGNTVVDMCVHKEQAQAIKVTLLNHLIERAEA